LSAPSSAPPELPGVTHREVALGGVRLHVAQAGSGPPLLLLHGWPQHWYCWRHLIAPLAQHYTVLAVDLRGWGWSQAPPGDYAKAVFADDILALVDAEGFDRVRIMGHDWGAYTGFLLALDHPERVERLVALDIVAPWRDVFRPSQLGAPLFLSYQYLLASPLGVPAMTRGRGFVRTVIRAGSGPGHRWSDDELDVYADVLREPDRARASSACYRTFLTRELPAKLRGAYGRGQLEVPSLLIMGGASALRRVIDPQPARNLSVLVIANAGHFLPEEAPQAVLDRAQPFLAGSAVRAR
jgi:pimeloyl-ACP methyl ester carboxylesterase